MPENPYQSPEAEGTQPEFVMSLRQRFWICTACYALAYIALDTFDRPQFWPENLLRSAWMLLPAFIASAVLTESDGPKLRSLVLIVGRAILLMFGAKWLSLAILLLRFETAPYGARAAGVLLLQSSAVLLWAWGITGRMHRAAWTGFAMFLCCPFAFRYLVNPNAAPIWHYAVFAMVMVPLALVTHWLVSDKRPGSMIGATQCPAHPATH